MHPTLRNDIASLAGRPVSLTPALPMLRRGAIIVDLDPSDWIDLTPPAHIAAAAMQKGRTA